MKKAIALTAMVIALAGCQPRFKFDQRSDGKLCMTFVEDDHKTGYRSGYYCRLPQQQTDPNNTTTTTTIHEIK